MKRAAAAILAPVAGILAAILVVAGLVAAPRPAAAQACDETWDYSAGLAEWTATGYSNVSGLMRAGTSAGITQVTLAELQGLAGTALPLASDGVQFYISVVSINTGTSTAIARIRYTDGSYNQTYYDPLLGLIVSAMDGRQISSIELESDPNGIAIDYDNATIAIPCGNWAEPTATPTAMTPTPTVTATATTTATATPLPTATATPLAYTHTVPLTGGVVLPPPVSIPPYSETLNIEPFWSGSAVVQWVSIVRTFFVLENIPQFFAIFLPVMGLLIGFRVVLNLIGIRAADRAMERQQRLGETPENEWGWLDRSRRGYADYRQRSRSWRRR